MSKLPLSPSKKFRIGQHKIKSELIKQAKKEGNILFGGRAIRERLGFNARPSKDFDFFSNAPKGSAKKAEMNLDRRFRDDLFFVKKGKNPGTFKTKFIGDDRRKNTSDDVGVADFTKTPRPIPKSFNRNGLKVRILKEELKAKQKVVRSPGFEFRKKKDLEDIRRIKRFGKRFL